MTSDDASPRLTWTDDGEPRSGRFGDVYFSRDDGLAETRAVFLTGCGLPEAWAGRRSFVVAELGFGTGLNIAALLDLWRRHRPDGGRLHVFSVEGFPLTTDEARRALANWPELGEAAQALVAAWPADTPGFHRVDLPDFHAVLDVAIGDAAWALDQWSGAADAWFLDGFSPALNPGMWSPQVLDRIAARSAPGARVATFTVAGAVRRGLAERGFAVEKRPGHGRKRERLEARLPSRPAPERRPAVAVIGAGVAGAAVARALMEARITPTVLETDRPGAGASGFPAALVTPRLDAGDEGIAVLHAQALERAGALYRRIPGAVTAEGVLQLPQAPRDLLGRFEKIAAQSLWPDQAMTVIDAEAAAAALGETVETGGLLMATALAIRPSVVLEAWLEGLGVRKATVAKIERTGSGLCLTDAAGDTIAEVDVVVLAGGWGSAGILAAVGDAPPLAPVRGQADWVDGVGSIPVAWGGYAAPTGNGLLYGATHDRADAGTTVREADSARNLEALHRRLPALARRVEAAGPSRSRTAVRATTPDRLPLAGPLGDSLFILGGLGSRGFCVAPLLAEHVVAAILGRPSPLPRRLAARVAPDRGSKP